MESLFMAASMQSEYHKIQFRNIPKFKNSKYIGYPKSIPRTPVPVAGNKNSKVKRMAALFRKPTKKIQKRKIDEDDYTVDEDESAKVADIRDLQRSRERKNGLTELECAVGISKAAALEDGIQMSGGGMVMTSKKKAAMEAASIEQGLREQFEKETMLRDEHEELRKYIDDGLQEYTKNVSSTAKNQPTTSVSAKFSSLTAEDRDLELLKQAAGKVKANQSKKETELLSEHMLAGIPEVDLGISSRITNILETEKKKRFLLDKSAAVAAGLPPPVEESDESKPKYRKRFKNQRI